MGVILVTWFGGITSLDLQTMKMIRFELLSSVLGHLNDDFWDFLFFSGNEKKQFFNNAFSFLSFLLLLPPSLSFLPLLPSSRR